MHACRYMCFEAANFCDKLQLAKTQRTAPMATEWTLKPSLALQSISYNIQCITHRTSKPPPGNHTLLYITRYVNGATRGYRFLRDCRWDNPSSWNQSLQWILSFDHQLTTILGSHKDSTGIVGVLIPSRIVNASTPRSWSRKIATVSACRAYLAMTKFRQHLLLKLNRKSPIWAWSRKIATNYASAV